MYSCMSCRLVSCPFNRQPYHVADLSFISLLFWWRMVSRILPLSSHVCVKLESAPLPLLTSQHCLYNPTLSVDTSAMSVSRRSLSYFISFAYVVGLLFLRGSTNLLPSFACLCLFADDPHDGPRLPCLEWIDFPFGGVPAVGHRVYGSSPPQDSFFAPGHAAVRASAFSVHRVILRLQKGTASAGDIEG